MAKPKTPSQIRGPFYSLSLRKEAVDSEFLHEYRILENTVGTVNQFALIYSALRYDTKGGPSTHGQQDLLRAMLVFACAGLDILMKQLIEKRLPALIKQGGAASKTFQGAIRRGLKAKEGELLNTFILALVAESPRDILIREYVEGLTGGSLQSMEEVRKIINAAGLAGKIQFSQARENKLRDAFSARNQIIHEMDINLAPRGLQKTGYRVRYQRQASEMKEHTKEILTLAEEIFTAFRTTTPYA